MRSALSWLVAVGVLVRLGASLECWSDLDDGSSVPKGAESASPSALPRLCSGTTASSYRRCNTGEESGLLLLEYTSRYRSWQRLLEMPYEPQGVTANSYYWLPHWSRRAPTLPPPPHTLATWSTLGASARSGSSSSPPST